MSSTTSCSDRTPCAGRPDQAEYSSSEFSSSSHAQGKPADDIQPPHRHVFKRAESSSSKGGVVAELPESSSVRAMQRANAWISSSRWQRLSAVARRTATSDKARVHLLGAGVLLAPPRPALPAHGLLPHRGGPRGVSRCPGCRDDRACRWRPTAPCAIPPRGTRPARRRWSSAAPAASRRSRRPLGRLARSSSGRGATSSSLPTGPGRRASKAGSPSRSGTRPCVAPRGIVDAIGAN